VRLAAAAAALLLPVLLLAPSVTAQEPERSPLIPEGHWSLEAARRLHGQGLMPPGYDPGITLQLVSRLLDAFGAAAGTSPRAAAYRARLVEEFGEGGAGIAARTWLGFGYRQERGHLYTGVGYEEDRPWHPSIARDPVATAAAHVRHQGSAGPVAWAVAGEVSAEGLGLDEAYLLSGHGPVVGWVGARGVGLPTAAGTGVVVHTLLPRPGAGLHLVQPVVLPWILRHLGPVQGSTMVVRAGVNHPYRNPWIWVMRLALEPHPRLQVGGNRGIMMGGKGNVGLTLRRVAMTAVGGHTDTWDNQLFSLTLRYRPPLGDWPVVTFLEWGMEDSSGAWRDVPGVMAGAEVPALPFAPALGLGLATTVLSPSCCGNPMWYRNWKFNHGWADDGRLLGHALGGHGREWRTYGMLDLVGARAQLSGQLFVRDRGDENVFAPAREGGSWGGGVEATLMPVPGWQLHMSGWREAGRGGAWRQTTVDVGVRGLL
jgi:hypothetical protein